MIYLVLPVGSFHGWGVCGKYITKELSKKTPIKLVSGKLEFDEILDEFDYRLLKGKIIADDEFSLISESASHRVNCPSLQYIDGESLLPMLPNFRGTMNVGYTFFEEKTLRSSSIENGKRYFDIVVTGSVWCESILRDHGLTNVKTIIQGIDPTLFNPFYPEKEYMQDAFVIFSGGKFELRKGQDIVIRAFKYLQDKYDDVFLVNSWLNLWPFSYETMAASPYLKISSMSGDFYSVIQGIFHENGIHPDKVMALPLYPNSMMARIYKNTDIGLFPNRCEGGTNLVLMEYMACGKPVIASYNSGHKDILTDANSIKLTEMKSMNMPKNIGYKNIADWEDPSLDEVIEKLELAYQNRGALKAIGIQAGSDLSKITWEKTAGEFYKVLTA